VPENTGKKTPGLDNALWETPEKQATAIDRLGPWRGYRPRPLQRLYLPKTQGPQRPLAMPTLEARARQALHLQALQPMAATTAAPNSSGFRPQRRGAEVLAPCFTIFRHPPVATWHLEGDRAGCFDHLALPWLAQPIPMPKRLLSTWLRSGVGDRGPLSPTPAGVPQGSLSSPGIRNMVHDGLAAVVHGGRWHRRGHQINDVRWADDFMGTANARAGLAPTVLPAVQAF